MAQPVQLEVIVGSKGQIVIPSDVRRALEISPGDRLVVSTHGTQVTLETRRAVLNRLRGKYQSDSSATQELLVERRAEAAKKW
jgi:AbrB family looped-hinge helix DNA binding protein